jgi:DNA-directed RNA polymerase subunit M/transcription elongation factor TFIIS
MPSGAYFIRSCPTCGRSLEVRVEYLGKRVSCQHCSAEFDTSDPPYFSDGASESSLNLLARAQELIESVKIATR